MKKFIFMSILAVMLLATMTMAAAPYTQKQIQFVNERNEPRTDLTYVKIWDTGTVATSTIYYDRGGTSMTNPMTPTSTRTGLRPENGLCTFFSGKQNCDVEAMVGGVVVKLQGVKASKTIFQVPLLTRPGAIRPKGGFCKFDSCVAGCQNDGTAASGSNTEVNIWSIDGVNFENINIGTQTILLPVQVATGLDVTRDVDAADEGWEITQGILASSRAAFTVGTDGPFHFSLKLSVGDVDGTDDFAIGFRKAEAYQAAVDNYDEMAAFNLNGSGTTTKLLQTETILNNGTTTTTALAASFADGATHILTVCVSRAGAVTYKIDGVADASAVAFSFDVGEVVIPFVYMIHDTGYANSIILQTWDCSLDD